jgi:hypothetical protein
MKPAVEWHLHIGMKFMFEVCTVWIGIQMIPLIISWIALYFINLPELLLRDN